MSDRMQRISDRARRVVPVDRVLEILDGLYDSAEPAVGEALDEAHKRVLAEVEPPASPTEQPHVTAIGGNLGVKPLGSPDPIDTNSIISQLNDTQTDALRAIAELAPKYRGGGVVPTGRFAHPPTAVALARRDLIEWRSFPHQGYKLTERGKAVVAAMSKED